MGGRGERRCGVVVLACCRGKRVRLNRHLCAHAHAHGLQHRAPHVRDYRRRGVLYSPLCRYVHTRIAASSTEAMHPCCMVQLRQTPTGSRIGLMQPWRCCEAASRAACLEAGAGGLVQHHRLPLSATAIHTHTWNAHTHKHNVCSALWPRLA
ncbi:hypothetical protein T440DRAFT_277061 [Plenodomus tracheiphilus IPT5]|uniref:Uncharacterized protein n=1 Tax=Plenodomus tracheiphilus IPT5 TaxID=1408161 RepID=A0A6A7AQ29_9PLEO|nr:hypothetical protein T440DRAFT_277061 [Plenodomus tracheiphilus IPT5]